MSSIYSHIKINDKGMNLDYFFSEKNLSILDFITSIYPIKASTELTNKNMELILHKILIILNFSIKAIYKFKKNDLRAFDAHVGETACHIRAYKTLILSLSKINFSESILIIESLIEKISCLSFNQTNIKLEDIINSFQLQGKIISPIPYLLHCYFLYEYTYKNQKNFPIQINLTKIIEQLSFTKKTSQKLVHYYQQKLAISSVKFMQKIAQELQKTKSFQISLRQSIKNGNSNRKIIPLFTSIKLINESLLKTKIYVVLKLQLQELPYEEIIIFQNSENYYEQINIENIKLPSQLNYCYVIHGKTTGSFNNILPKINLLMRNLKLLELNAAAHKQYVDDTNHTLPDEYKIHHTHSKSLAYKLGCTTSNQKLFVIEHIYAAHIKSIINSEHLNKLKVSDVA